jgi:hypothetical protein
MRAGLIVTAVALFGLCAAPLPTAGQDASATVTTTFNLYGNSVEPFDDAKQSALKTAIAQSAGHGVTADNVQISVDHTYADQQKSGRRRLLQNTATLVQPGVQVTSQTQTTQQLATSVSQSLDNALQNNQIAQVYSANGQQADYTTVVTASNTGSSGGSSPSGTSPSPSDSNSSPNTNTSPNSGSTNSSPSNSGGGGSSFPTWVIAIIVILVLLLIGLLVGCLCWRRRAKRRAIQAQEFQAATYFSNSEGLGAKVSDTWGDIKEGTAGFFSKFRKAPLPIVATTSPAPANPSTPFSQVGFGGSPTPGITRTNSGGNMSGDKYGGFVTRAPTTPKGSSIPSPGAYQAAPKVSSPGLYTPKRAGRLESLKDINDI